ncbi:hypothetical protein FH972_023773 [Carpinus fangiana]|uniref:Chloride channel protein n=1 Tax=Carpinus fangiana TaxID=176857 RepID=A0A5N6KWT6_9ROSI|nr:hypothetical protein FH972_023773 [Carpinus fangiana]
MSQSASRRPSGSFDAGADEVYQAAQIGRGAPRNRSSPSSRSTIRELNTQDLHNVSETSSLLANRHSPEARYDVSPSVYTRTPRAALTRQSSFAVGGGNKMRRIPSQVGTFTARVSNAFKRSLSRPGSTKAYGDLDDSLILDSTQDRLWYDQFTTIDWVHDNIIDSERQKSLHNLPGIRGRLIAASHGAEGWILAALIGCMTAAMAYLVDVSESWLFDVKFGSCTTSWHLNKSSCCGGRKSCDEWTSWGQKFSASGRNVTSIDFFTYMFFMILFSTISCVIAMTVRLRVPHNLASMKMDDDLALSDTQLRKSGDVQATEVQRPHAVTYPATGSGVAEVRVILSGFVLHGYLGWRTLLVKAVSLVLSVASGLAIGKEGPFVHISTAIGNVLSRMSPKYQANDGKRREMLSAGAAAGVAVAFGAPISGVLFSLEEVSYYFPSKTLFRTFFGSIVAAVMLKLLNPYGTSKIVLFQVHYTKDWHAFEVVFFIVLGILGGAIGAGFIKGSRWWARRFRGLRLIKKYPLLEVFLIALVTGLTTFWNRYTSKPVTELMFELSSDCMSFNGSTVGLCPDVNEILPELGLLLIAFLLKAILTTVTFGIKVPAGIYIPSMILGGLLGRTVGHLVQYLVMTFTSPSSTMMGTCAATGNPEDCVVPGVYALLAAAATMCGVTRLTVTIAVIMFELTGSIDHVLPFSIAVLAAKWTADAIEPLSIYDLLTETNGYPFLDAKTRPLGLNGELGDITSSLTRKRFIDITHGPTLRASVLRGKLDFLYDKNENDGGMPIVRDGVLVGLIPLPDMEFALDRLAQRKRPHFSDQNQDDHQDEGDEDPLVLLAVREAWPRGRGELAEELIGDESDFTPFIDPSPIALDIHSSMELVYECFQKLGLRYICVSREGLHAGLVHKKAFVRYAREHKE